MQFQGKQIYQFGVFLLDVDERLLLEGGQRVPLGPKAFDTLVLLVQNSGRLVDKATLMRTVWQDSFVEENAINKSISLLRKALGESDNLKYIETVPKHGYRFIAEVVPAFESDTIFVVEKHTEAEIISEEVTDAGATELEDDHSRTLPAGAAVASLSLTSRLRRHALPKIATAGFLIVAIIVFSLTIEKLGRGSASSPVKSIAVLPFNTIDGNKESGPQGLGMADILITRLSNIRELNVRPTSTVVRFENREQDSFQIGRELQVDAVLEGTIYHSNDKVRVTVRLVKVSDQSPIWAGQFEKPLQDELRLQDEIALQVVDALSLNLGADQKRALTKRYTPSADAYDLYLRGRYHWNKRDNPGLIDAEHLFRKAIDQDPNFALAYVGVADKQVLGNDPGEAAFLIDKALKLDPDLAEAYATRGFLNTFHCWAWREAEADFKRSIKLKPGYGTAHQWYATLLMIQARPAEAKAELRRALEINPQSYNFLADLGQAHYFAREYDKAEEYCYKALALYPDFLFAHGNLKEIYFQTGEYGKAIEEMAVFENALSAQPSQGANPRGALEAHSVYRDAYQKGGIKGFWQKQLEETLRHEDKNANKYLAIARVYLESGDSERSLDYLEKAYEQKAFLLSFVNADPVYDRIRAKPRFQALLHRMGLAP